MCLLSWRKTNLCIISILSRKSMSKLINVNCLHFTGCQNYTNVLINHVLYQIQVTSLLTFFLSILHLLFQLSKIMLWSTMKLLLAIVMTIFFRSIKNSSEVIEKLRLRNFQGFQVSFFRFFYFINLIAAQSYQSKSVVSGQLVFQQRVKILPLYFT